MSDIALIWNASLGAADAAVSANDLAADDGLETAVLLSLFTDRRAEEGDVLPAGQTDRRGWWGDVYPVANNDRFGSKLWLLARSKQTQETLTLAETYARESLQWLIDDLVSDRVDVAAEWVRNGVMGLSINIHRPGKDSVRFRFDKTWAAQEA
jgi:phage gp46-like protein